MGLVCWLLLLVVVGAAGVAWVAATDAACARIMSPLVLEVQKTGLQKFDLQAHEQAIVRAGEMFVKTSVDAVVRRVWVEDMRDRGVGCVPVYSASMVF
jgi:hypothetical protein